MKRISTLAIVAFFFCLSTMAQVVLGDINFSLKEGQKISPKTGKITVTFPNVSGVADPTATNFAIAGAFNDIDFDGLEGSFASGVTLDLAEFELQPATAYVLKITSVKVSDTELAPAEGYTLNFKTRGAERKMEWTFTIDEASVAKILEDENAEGNETAGIGTYWSVITANQRHYIHQKLDHSEVMLDANTPLPMTEDLLFTINADKVYVGDVTDTKYTNSLVFNANAQQITIPDCQEGDVITFNSCKYATKPSTSKFPVIVALNGGAIAPDGLVSSSGLQDSIDVPKNATNLRFEVVVAGDVSFTIGQCNLTGITISEAQPKLPRNYNVVAAYVDEDNMTVLKELVSKTEGITGSTYKVNYPYWLTDTEGKAYTHGAKGSEFIEAFELKNGEGDTTFVINYAKTEYEGVVFLSEGEDLEGAVLCTSNNAAVRSSMGKAGYVTEDLKLVTLQPGTYKIRAILFDADKEPAYICTLTKGAGEENEIYLSAVSTNWTEAESDLLTITEATDITLKAGGGDNHGVDVIMIYAATEDPDGILEVKSAKNAAVRKVVKNGQVLIETEAGIFNALGVQMK
jgi:hypothetical protein